MIQKPEPLLDVALVLLYLIFGVLCLLGLSLLEPNPPPGPTRTLWWVNEALVGNSPAQPVGDDRQAEEDDEQELGHP